MLEIHDHLSIFKKRNMCANVYPGCLSDEINDLLLKSVKPKKDYAKAEKAIILIERYRLTSVYLNCRVLVHFPHLLKRYLTMLGSTRDKIAEDDLCSMFARCIEQSLKVSLKHLLAYSQGTRLEIKLLLGKYTINESLYKLAKKHNVKDSYFDASLLEKRLPYEHLNVEKKDESGSYSGFRDAYHILIYGGRTHLFNLISWWNKYGDDYTTDAAREYLNIHHSKNKSPVSVVIKYVETLASRRTL